MKIQVPKVSILTLASPTVCAILVTGCASTGGPQQPKAAVAQTNQQAAPFVAPYDPKMGQVVIAVPEVTVSAPVPPTAGNLGKLVRSQLAGVLSSSANLVIADRETLAEIAQEHKLAEGGATDPLQRPANGHLASPRFLIKADVTEFKEEAAGSSKGGKFELGTIAKIIGAAGPQEARLAMGMLQLANPSIGGGKERVHGLVGIDLRVIDVDTGSVVRATRASSSLSRENSRVVFGVAGLSLTDTHFEQSVVAEAMRLAVQDAVVQIHSIVRERTIARADTTALARSSQ